jgi:hypothetical protein
LFIKPFLASPGCGAFILRYAPLWKVRGWTNYFNIPGVSHPFQSFDRLKWYIGKKLSDHYRRKSQRGSTLYRRLGYEGFVSKFGLIDPVLTLRRRQPVNA